MHRFDPTALREYDIRGIVGETLDTADATAIGRCFGTVVARAGGRRVAVGYDGRASSPGFADAVAAGLNASGITAVRVGLGPTPMLYYAVHDLGCDGGIMVTGSHNPPDYNGFKLLLASGPFYGTAIQAMGTMAAAGDWADGTAGSETVDIMDRYVDRLVHGLAAKPFTIAWDAGNGAAGPVVERLVKRLPGTHHLLFTDVDPAFPNHHPDPTEEKNLADLKRVVLEKGCDFGVAFDGDGDRLGAVDGHGRVVWGDQLLSILAGPVLAALPGATIIADVKASAMLFDRVRELGGVPLMAKTGHSLIKAKMQETGAPLAGEMSGHIFFAHDWYRLRRRAVRRRPADRGDSSVGPVAGRAEGRDATAGQHAGTAFPVVGRPQVRGRCRGAGPAESGRRGCRRDRRRARHDARRLVAAARVEHPGRAGRAGRGEGRRGAGAAAGRPQRRTGGERGGGGGRRLG